MYRWILAVYLLVLGCSGAENNQRGVVVVIDLGGDAARPDAGPADAIVELADRGAIPDAVPLDGQLPDASESCSSDMGMLPAEYEVIEYHDGQPLSHVQAQSWSVVEVPIGQATLNESVVFELSRPARILGYAVQFGYLPESHTESLTVSLHPDFGYNGFDFWPSESLASVSRCGDDIGPNEWVEFILASPIEVEHPGLVHVVHQRTADGPALAFDGSPPTPDCGNDCCSDFGACHSAWNFPELKQFRSGGQLNYAYNGLSLSFQYDYLVRLYVQYTDSVTADEHVFRRVPDVQTSNRLAWADYDNDGDDDLLVNGPKLFRNDDGLLIDVTDVAFGELDSISGSGVFADYDNDGCLDLFLFNESYQVSDFLLRSDCEGAFTDVTAQAGFNDVVEESMSCDGGDRAPTAAATWIDVDADGFLDLYVANFLCWSSGRPYLDQVWRSRGDGTFEEWTGTNGFAGLDDRRAHLSSRGALAADFDTDGDVDLLVNTYRLNRNLYYRNDNGQFSEVGEESRFAGQATRWQGYTYYGHSIGAAVGDLDGDADLDVVIANLAHPRFYDFSDKTQVLLNQGAGLFEDIQGDWSRPMGAAGLRFQETHSVPSLADFDNDGALDLVLSAVYVGRPTDFYWGNGDGTFRLDAWRSGIDVTNGWGQAVADIDRDGRLDLATSGGIFMNQHPMNGHWLQVRVVGNAGANRAAIGAVVRAYAGERIHMRAVTASTGQGCQDSLYLHFGLGQVDEIDRITVQFPGDATPVEYDGPFAADQRLWLYQDGSITMGWNGVP